MQSMVGNYNNTWIIRNLVKNNRLKRLYSLRILVSYHLLFSQMEFVKNLKFEVKSNSKTFYLIEFI